MQLNNAQFKDAMVFRNEFNGHPVYSISISGKKYQDGHETGSYVNTYLNVQFKGDYAPEHKEHIDITNSFLTAFEGKDGNGKMKLVVMEWHPHSDEDVPY